ncbi:MAG TPA: DNA polymerase domain-containing protein [Candidatus Methylomirabilis sp.]|nr:DNA polymerase domain-containing protein [Candidatus Methylomirabilis sp.]
MMFETPAFHQNAILFGHDPTPRLLAFEPEGDDRIRIFRRTQDGRVESELRPFRPFVLLASTDFLSGWTGGFDVEGLTGEGLYRFLVLFHGWGDALKARAQLTKVTGKAQTAPDAPFLFFADPVQQYLMLSGQTHFLELPFGELRRMQLDIETYCAAGYEFPNAGRAEDRITAIALADSTGWERVISGAELAEPDMLRELIRLVAERDPDVLEGHNLFRFDLEYIAARAARHKVKLQLGRGGAVLRGHPSRMQIAERAITYKKFEVSGRHIIDTWMLAQHYDVTARELEGYGLKEIAKHFGLATDARTYILPEQVSWYFDHEPETLFRYALDDVRETRGVSQILSQSYFAQAQIFPFSYQNVALRGNATKIDALLIREYLRQRRAIPAPEPPQEVLGGHTEIAHQGVARRILHCDVTSLYPSVMLAFGAFPRRDSLGVFPTLLTDLRAFRVEAKRLARTAETVEGRAYFEALQTTFKILINSFYGYLGFSMGHFNDYAAANQVTAKGRELIQAVMAWLTERGARLVEIDTDGLYFVAPPDVRTPEDEERLLAELTKILPAGISLEMDGRYQAMFSYKMKNYALLDYDGRLSIKGSGLRSRGLELFQREWMEEMFVHLLKGEPQKIRDLTRRYAEAFEQHAFDVRMFMKTETLQDSLETYRDKLRGSRRNPAATYELALRSERPYQPGDQVSYYVAGTSKKVKVHEAAKLASEWDPKQPDENVEYYKAKLVELYEKFKPFIETAEKV